MLLSQALVGASFLLGAVNAILAITTAGNKFFDSDGNQFFIKGKLYLSWTKFSKFSRSSDLYLLIKLDNLEFKLKLIITSGVAYQLTEADPLLDKTQCSLDATLMKKLGANTIRVYHVCGLEMALKKERDIDICLGWSDQQPWWLHVRLRRQWHLSLRWSRYLQHSNRARTSPPSLRLLSMWYEKGYNTDIL